jgi:hypothetical protein
MTTLVKDGRHGKGLRYSQAPRQFFKQRFKGNGKIHIFIAKIAYEKNEIKDAG